jgi:hypothetical protein
MIARPPTYGFVAGVGRYHHVLRKPTWTPPPYVFPLVWTPLKVGDCHPDDGDDDDDDDNENEDEDEGEGGEKGSMDEDEEPLTFDDHDDVRQTIRDDGC